VDNFIAGIYERLLAGDIRILILIPGLLFILYLIGRQPLTKLLFSIVRGTVYLFTAAVVIYLIKYYPREILYHAHRFWNDLNNFFGLG
jgi:hypothetical protein